LSPADPTKKLHSLMKKLRAEYPGACDAAVESLPEGQDPLVWQLVFSFMCWEANSAKAGQATRKLHAGVIDYNEMRVCLPDELIGLIGERYPRASERVQRLRSALNDLYRREHTVTLQHLPTMPKREARTYLESLEGVPGFVASRLMLLSLGGHAFPLDERLYLTLTEEQAVPDAEFDDVAGWLERAFHAGETAEPYLLLEAWLNDRPAPRPPKKPVVIKSPPKPKAPEPEPPRPPRPLKGESGKAPGKKAAKS
jgi:hypothetical protein